VLKQTKPGVHVKPLELEAFPSEEKLCVVSHLQKYLEVTESLRQGKELFVSFVKPHSSVSRDTISRWIKTVLELAGVDVTRFSAHSTRGASTSAAFSRNVAIDTILSTAGWASQSTFCKFYCKPVGQTLGQSVLAKFAKKA
jgi:hypothetical protein